LVEEYADGYGGGLYNAYGTVTLINSIVRHNSAIKSGGGIGNFFGVLELIHSEVSYNDVTDDALESPSASGGGILNLDGQVKITASTIRGNHVWGGLDFEQQPFGSGGGLSSAGGVVEMVNTTVSGNDAFYQGGGLFSVFTTMRLSRSTVSGNSASGLGVGEGGGIFASAGGFESGTLKLVNSTVSGNNATAYGGGIYNYFNSTIQLLNSTISNNTTDGEGGGIFNLGITDLPAIVEFGNSIVADQMAGGDCAGDPINPIGPNLDSDGSCGASQTSAYSGLGPLQNNGGPTETQALLPDSPAIDVGNNVGCAATTVNGIDQRGVSRPQGLACDLGAFELIPVNGSGVTGH